MLPLITIRSNDYLFDEPLLLVAEDGENLVSRKLPIAFSIAGKSWVNNHTHVLRVTGADRFFLEHYINSVDLTPYLTGATRPKLNKASLLNIPILLPPLAEQRAIACTLRTMQEAREVRQRELELERERKAALMQHLFTHGTRGEPCKQTEIGEIPESWRVVQLEYLCNEGRGSIQTGPFGSQLHATDYREIGIPVVNPTHLGFNTIIEDRLPFISEEDANRLLKHQLREGDILISRRGDFSRYSYITPHHVGWVCGTGCLLIRINHPEVDNYFLSISMGTESAQNYFEQNAVGSIMPNLNTKILQGLPLKLPSVSEQRAIGETLQSCDTKIATLEREIELYDELFRAMLEELMTGRLSAVPLIEALQEVPS